MPPTSPPRPDDTAPRRLGVYGGTFDPVHVGHLIIAAQIAEQLQLERVLFVPSGVSPHKLGHVTASAADRVAMLRLATADNPAFVVDMLEIERTGPSWTADTVEQIAARGADAALWFLMGADSLVEFHTWHDPLRILLAARLAVAMRPGSDIDLDALGTRTHGLRERTSLIETTETAIASHDIRKRVAAGRTIRYLVPAEVEQFIAAHGLYGLYGGT